MTALGDLALDCSLGAADGLDAPLELDEGAVSTLVRTALEAEGQVGPWVINIALVDADEISRLHDRFLGDPTLTDIITFPYDEPGLSGGDIAICLPIAAEQGAEHGKSLTEELHFLILHGVLHLVGRDDGSADLRAAMLHRQQEIYDAWLAANR